MNQLKCLRGKRLNAGVLNNEPMIGFEPTTYALRERCSTKLSYIGILKSI